ncbi:MAG: DUF2298 domain-containing protein, partial [Patescibacteria group bacterium]|nr:DUF2298 domain-containing protein [Patescibacteria group bacterium]
SWMEVSPWFFGLSFLFFLFNKKFKFSFNKKNLVLFLSRALGIEVEVKNPPPTANFSTSPLTPDFFVLILFLISTVLIIIPEIIYLKDIYIPSYHRANTMFKLTYQSFMMFSITIGYIIIRVLSSLKKGVTKKVFFILYFLIFTLLMVYPYYSIPGYYGNLNATNYKGLYGLSFIKKLYPDDYQTILWLNRLPGQPKILEAAGDSYTDFERFSMATGLPTIEGWLVHEWLWRGSYDEPGKRNTEVQTIYETKDAQTAQEILKKYQIKYVIIGEMERQKYPNFHSSKFSQIGKKVFESGKTAVFELL